MIPVVDAAWEDVCRKKRHTDGQSDDGRGDEKNEPSGTAGPAVHDDNEENKPGPVPKAKRSFKGYEAELWSFIQLHWPSKWESYADLGRCKIVVHKMRKVELDESFYQYCEVYSDFTLEG